MSRVAKRPVALPQGVTATITPSQVTVKGAKGSLSVAVSNGVTVKEENKQLQVSYTDGDGVAALAGSTRAHLANVVQGVTAGFEKKLELVGVGYRAAVQGKVLTLTLGYSHAIVFDVPAGSTITLTNGEIKFKDPNITITGPGASALTIDANDTAAQTIEYGYVFEGTRRGLYLPAFRNRRPDLLEAFDAASLDASSGRRSTSTVPAQALVLANHPPVVEACRQVASRVRAEAADVPARVWQRQRRCRR